jgi:hypothetical protein
LPPLVFRWWVKKRNGNCAESFGHDVFFKLPRGTSTRYLNDNKNTLL